MRCSIRAPGLIEPHMDQPLENFESPASPAVARARRSDLWRRWLLLAHKPTAVAAMVVLVFWVVVAVVGPAIAPYGINEISSGAVWKAPSAAHLMGTDALGRDIFSRLV